MLEYLIVLLMGLLGVYGGAWWLVFVGAVAISVEPSLDQYQTLKQHPKFTFNWTIATAFAFFFSYAVAACSTVYMVGRFGRSLLML